MKKRKLTVRLASVGNPDYGQDPDRPIYGAQPNKIVPVASLQEASRECLRFIAHNDLGCGNWDGGQITESGRVIAHVSYNGRVWEGPCQSWNQDTKELLD